MSHFEDKVLNFYDNFWELVSPFSGYAMAIASASDVRGDLAATLSNVVANVTGIYSYESDLELFGQEDYWASADEVSRAMAGDCDDLAMVGSSVLLYLRIPHYVVIGHLRDQIEGLEATPEAASGHVWLEVDDDFNTYILEFTNPMVWVIQHGQYEKTPYVPIDSILVE